jgi:hypothetical protein
MPANYTITVDVDDPDTLAFLESKSLRVYKGVGTGGRGLPVVWFSQTGFDGTISFSWNEQYAGFILTGGMPTPGVRINDPLLTLPPGLARTAQDDPVITVQAALPMELGHTFVAQDNSNPSVVATGVPGALAIANSGTQDWMCGMGQEVNGGISALCAFDLGGEGEQVVMIPQEKVLLVFESSTAVDTGMALAEAINASLMVELDVQDSSRTVVFRKDTGWSTNQQAWATQVPIDTDLASVLFVPLADARAG